jgi:hypothetical protein
MNIMRAHRISTFRDTSRPGKKTITASTAYNGINKNKNKLLIYINIHRAEENNNWYIMYIRFADWGLNFGPKVKFHVSLFL